MGQKLLYITHLVICQSQTSPTDSAEEPKKRSTLITSQLPVDKWHRYLEDPTLADAILDRVVHNAYRIEMKGESIRKRKGEKS